MEIKKTYDYSKFKFLSYNRAVGSNKKLMRSIEMANLTSVCPIIVTPKLEIIDGQNRFEVCKSKGMPIFYVVYEGDAETAMKAINTCSQPWRQEEWMQYYLAKGVPNYVALKDFMDMYNLPISNAILIFSNGSTNAATFKKGMLNRTGKYHNEIAIFLNDISSILPRDIVSFRAFDADLGYLGPARCGTIAHQWCRDLSVERAGAGRFSEPQHRFCVPVSPVIARVYGLGECDDSRIDCGSSGFRGDERGT